MVWKAAATRSRYGVGLQHRRHAGAAAHPSRNLRTQILLNSRARRFSHSHKRAKNRRETFGGRKS